MVKRARPKRRWKKLDDDSLMPWGKHEGTEMANVPAEYLMYVHYQGWGTYPVQEYIRENLDALRKEIDKQPPLIFEDD